MKSLSRAVEMAANDATRDAAKIAKRQMMRRFTWCRLEHEMLDHVRWRLVARLSGAPIHLIEAFTVRLEVFASANKPRGSLDGFNFATLSAHWNLPNAEQLGRIYAAMEHPDVGWIDQDQLVTFWDRNPDTEDETAALRQRRSRIRRRIPGQLAKLARLGALDTARRNEIEATLGDIADDELFALEAELKRELGEARRAGYPLSRVTCRDTVTVTTRSDQIIKKVGDFSSNANGVAGQQGSFDKENRESAVHSNNGDCRDNPELWLATEGVRIVCERAVVAAPHAGYLIKGWNKKLHYDDAALVEIVAGVETLPARRGEFLDQVRLRVNAHRPDRGQRSLPLPAVLKRRS